MVIPKHSVITQIDEMTQAYYPIVVLVLVAPCRQCPPATFFGQVTWLSERAYRYRSATVLEASRIGKIPHQSVCGGRSLRPAAFASFHTTVACRR